MAIQDAALSVQIRHVGKVGAKPAVFLGSDVISYRRLQPAKLPAKSDLPLIIDALIMKNQHRIPIHSVMKRVHFLD